MNVTNFVLLAAFAIASVSCHWPRREPRVEQPGINQPADKDDGKSGTQDSTAKNNE